MHSKPSPNPDQPAARVALKAPRPDSLVEVRLTPPDSNFEVKVSPDGETIELIIHPGAGLVTVRLSPPTGDRPAAVAPEGDDRPTRAEADEVAPGISRAEAEALIEEEESVEAVKLLALLERKRDAFPEAEEAAQGSGLPPEIQELLEEELDVPLPDDVEMMGAFPPPEETAEPETAGAAADEPEFVEFPAAAPEVPEEADDGNGDMAPPESAEAPQSGPDEAAAGSHGELRPYDPDFDDPGGALTAPAEVDADAGPPLDAEKTPESADADEPPLDAEETPESADAETPGDDSVHPSAETLAPFVEEEGPRPSESLADENISPLELPRTEECTILNESDIQPAIAAPADEEPEYLEEIVAADLVPDTELIDVENGSREEPLILELAEIGQSPRPSSPGGAEENDDDDEGGGRGL